MPLPKGKLRRRQLTAIIYALLVLAFVLVPFGSAAHTALGQRLDNYNNHDEYHNAHANNEIPPDLHKLMKSAAFFRIGRTLQNLFGDDIFRARVDIGRLKESLISSLQCARDSNNERALWEDLLAGDSTTPPTQDAIERFVGSQYLRDTFSTAHEVFSKVISGEYEVDVRTFD